MAVLLFEGFLRIEDSNRRILAQIVPKLETINAMEQDYKKIRIELRTLGLNGLDKKDAENAIKSISQSITAYEDNLKKIKLMAEMPGEKEINEELMLKWSNFKIVGENALALHQSGKAEDLKVLLKLFLVDSPVAAKAYDISSRKAIDFHKKNLSIYTNELENLAKQTNVLILSLTLIGIFTCLVIGSLFAKKISKSINEIVHKLEESAEEVSATSTQIASSSEGISLVTTEQVVSLRETSYSIGEIKSKIASNTENAKLSVQASVDSLESAVKGKDVVGQMIKAIDVINVSNRSIMEQINKSNKEIEELVKVIEEIGAKTKVINDIVFQTKQLSHHASVDARAGDDRKGYAEVAEEVGNLAAISGAAALEMSIMLDDSMKKVEEIVKNSKDKIGKLVVYGNKNVETGAKIANECGEVLDEIVMSVASVAKSVSEISIASQEQAQGVIEITKVIAQIDQAARENRTNSVESVNSAEVLSAQATSLHGLVQELLHTMNGTDQKRKKC